MLDGSTRPDVDKDTEDEDSKSEVCVGIWVTMRIRHRFCNEVEALGPILLNEASD